MSVRIVRTLALVILACALAPSVAGQEASRGYSGDYTLPENVIGDLYRAVSFRPGDTGDWAKLAELILPSAIIGQPARGGNEEEVHSLDSFIELFKRDVDQFQMSENGFREEIGGLTIDTFGNICHAWVVFVVYAGWEADQPQGRGLDGIHLVRQDNRWWITSIATAFERPGRPIPAKYLKTVPPSDSRPE
jgi:hypothetical protein